MEELITLTILRTHSTEEDTYIERQKCFRVLDITSIETCDDLNVHKQNICLITTEDEQFIAIAKLEDVHAIWRRELQKKGQNLIGYAN